MEIIPQVHLVPGVTANTYLIIDSDGLTLIDAGLPGSHTKILKYMAGLGHAPTDLKRILITHSDLDHVGALARLKKASRSRTYASAVEGEAIAQGKSSRPIRPRQFGIRVLMAIFGVFVKASPVDIDEILIEGATLPVLGGLTVLQTPGHTPGHVSLFSPSTGILFVCDSIISRDNGLVGSLPTTTWDPARAAESVRKQAALGARIVCSGHGPVVKDAIRKMPAV